MRRFEQSHQWLKFTIEKIDRDSLLWALLGECQSKCEHVAGVPLRPDVAQNLHRLYLAKGALATTAIEGNTLSEEEVLRVLDGDLKLPPSREYLKQEVDNVFEAFSLIYDQVKKAGLPPLSVDELKSFNRCILKDLSLEEGVVPGEIRKHSVGVSRYRGAPPEDCQYLLERLIQWLEEGKEFKLPSGMTIISGILKAVAAHLYLAWIHPFGDGNGRTARLVEYRILLDAGVPTPSVHLLSNHYNLTRAEYYRQLDRASTSGGDFIPFFEYALSGFADGLREQIVTIRNFQLDVVWRNYVHELFGERKTDVDRRRRDLVLSLSARTVPVKIASIPTMDSKMTAAYMNKSRMLLNRDLRALRAQKLVLHADGGGVFANRKLVEAFLPFRIERESKSEGR